MDFESGPLMMMITIFAQMLIVILKWFVSGTLIIFNLDTIAALKISILISNTFKWNIQ